MKISTAIQHKILYRKIGQSLNASVSVFSYNVYYVKLKRLFRKLFRTKQTDGTKRGQSDAEFYALLTLAITAIVIAITS